MTTQDEQNAVKVVFTSAETVFKFTSNPLRLEVGGKEKHICRNFCENCGDCLDCYGEDKCFLSDDGKHTALDSSGSILE